MLLRSYVVAHNWFHYFAEDRELGATSVEYALIVGVLGVGIMTSFAFYRNSVNTAFNRVPATWPT